MPELTVTVTHFQDEPGGLLGCIESNVPFGSMDVPVEVVDQDGERRVAALVDVVDGQGSFWVPNRAKDAQVELDPMGLVLAYDRKVKWSKKPACERPNVQASSAPKSAEPPDQVERIEEPKEDESLEIKGPVSPERSNEVLGIEEPKADEPIEITDPVVNPQGG